MSQLATGIDHPIIAIRDMAAGRAAFERLGFTVTPRGRHLEWGTGNWCKYSGIPVFPGIVVVPEEPTPPKSTSTTSSTRR